MSELCLGTMTFGWQADEPTSHRILDRFVEVGGSFVDTANVYSEGAAERILGSWLKGRDRSALVLATKARFRTGEGANDVGLSRKHLWHAVRASLERLGTDYIDLLQVHTWDALTPLEETFGTLDQMVRDGLVRYVGISNYRGWQFERALQLCRRRGWSEPVSLQSQYSLYARATEFELLPMCRAEGVAMLPWSPLGGGVLSGKYRDGLGHPPPGTRIAESEAPEAYAPRLETDRARRILSAVETVARDTGKSMVQVALNWLLSHPEVTAPIVGARTPEQVAEDAGSTGWALTSEQVAVLDRASALEVTYPYDARAEDQQQRDRRLDAGS